LGALTEEQLQRFDDLAPAYDELHMGKRFKGLVNGSGMRYASFVPKSIIRQIARKAEMFSVQSLSLENWHS
jgi:hypothetical protein